LYDGLVASVFPSRNTTVAVGRRSVYKIDNVTDFV